MRAGATNHKKVIFALKPGPWWPVLGYMPETIVHSMRTRIVFMSHTSYRWCLLREPTSYSRETASNHWLKYGRNYSLHISIIKQPVQLRSELEWTVYSKDWSSTVDLGYPVLSADSACRITWKVTKSNERWNTMALVPWESTCNWSSISHRKIYIWDIEVRQTLTITALPAKLRKTWMKAVVTAKEAEIPQRQMKGANSNCKDR